jgi:hypothetical protein
MVRDREEINMDEQKQALYYYLANQEEINKGHMGEYVGIYRTKVVSYYKDWLEGGLDMFKRGYKAGTFNVIPCHPVGEPSFSVGGFELVGEPL